MSKRHAIIEIHRAGVSNSMIIKQSLIMTKTVLKVDAFAQLVHPRSSKRLVRGSKGIQNGVNYSEKWLRRGTAQEALRVSVESFRGRLERVVKAKGGHIEI